MKTLEKKSNSMRKALNELRILSQEPSARELYEIRRKAKLDKAAQLSYAYDKGLEEGIQKGIEQGLYVGIQLNLQSRFNVKNPPVMKLIRKIKDIAQLKEIFIFSAKAKTLDDIEAKLKRKFSKTKKK